MDILIGGIAFIIGLITGYAVKYLLDQIRLKRFEESISNDLREYAVADVEETLAAFDPNKRGMRLDALRPHFVQPPTDAQQAEAEHYDRVPREVLIYETLAEEYDKNKEKTR